MIPFEARMRQGGDAAIQEASYFFDGTDTYHRLLHSFTGELREAGIPYAISGGAALVAHGCWRTTRRIDVIVARECADAVAESAPNGVNVLTAGDYVDDYGAVALPNPAETFVEIDGVRYVPLERLIELKLASGIGDASRINDLADIQELIRAIRPPRELAERLDPYVRGKYLDLWDGLASDDATL